MRTYLTSGGVFASAGILALGLVAVPPDVSARTEVRAVQLAAWTLPPAAERWGALLREFISNQSQTVVPVTKVAAGGAADIPAVVVNTPTAGGTAPLTVDAATDPAMNLQKADATALAATPDASSLLDPIVGFLGVLVLFGPLIVLVILACPPCALINFLSYFLPLPTVPLAAAASIETVEASATVGPALTSDPPLQVTETEKADGSAPVKSDDKRTGTGHGTSTEPATANEETSTETAKDVTETVESQQASTERPAASDAESPVDASEPAKPAVRPATQRPVVRDSLGTGTKVSDPSHRGTGGRATTHDPADDRAATAGSSSAASSSADSASKSGGSSDGDTGGSE